MHALKPFHQCTLEEASTIKATQSGKGKERAKFYFSHNTIVPTFSDSSILLSLPSNTLEGIWTKALELSNNSKAIVPMPGGGDKDCFVLSKSSTMPHAITVKGSLYHCDARCMHYQSLTLCAHTVVAAHKNGDLEGFIDALAARRVQPNLFQLSKHGMPRGAGKKGNTVPRRKRKATTVVMNDDSLLNAKLPHQTSASRVVPQDNQASLSNTGPLGNYSSSAPRDVPQDNQASLSNAGPLENYSMTSSAPKVVPQDNQASLSNTGPLGNYSMTSSAPRVVPQASLSNTGPLGNYSLSAYRVVPQDNQASFSNTGLGIYQPSNANTVPLSQSYFSGGPPHLTTPLAFQLRRPLGLQSPPLLSPPSDVPYVLVFVKGNITTCFGCRAKFMKPSVPPYNLIVQHKDYRSYTDQEGVQQHRF